MCFINSDLSITAWGYLRVSLRNSSFVRPSVRPSTAEPQQRHDRRYCSRRKVWAGAQPVKRSKTGNGRRHTEFSVIHSGRHISAVVVICDISKNSTVVATNGILGLFLLPMLSICAFWLVRVLLAEVVALHSAANSCTGNSS